MKVSTIPYLRELLLALFVWLWRGKSLLLFSILVFLLRLDIRIYIYIYISFKSLTWISATRFAEFIQFGQNPKLRKPRTFWGENLVFPWRKISYLKFSYIYIIHCPLEGYCLRECMVYEAKVSAKNDFKLYYGTCEGEFKSRF